MDTAKAYKRKVVEHLRCCFDTDRSEKDDDSSRKEMSELHDRVEDLAGEDYINLIQGRPLMQE